MSPPFLFSSIYLLISLEGCSLPLILVILTEFTSPIWPVLKTVPSSGLGLDDSARGIGEPSPDVEVEIVIVSSSFQCIEELKEVSNEFLTDIFIFDGLGRMQNASGLRINSSEEAMKPLE